MAEAARWGLKLEELGQCPYVIHGLKGGGSPRGFETGVHPVPEGCRSRWLKGRGSPMGFDWP